MIEDKHHIIRNAGLDKLDKTMTGKIQEIVLSDQHSSTRAKALKIYDQLVGAESLVLAEKVLIKEEGYDPIIEAIKIVKKYNKPKAIQYADKLRNENAKALVGLLTEIFSESGDAKYLDYIEENLEKVNVYQVFNVFGKYGQLLLKQDPALMMEKAENLKAMAMGGGNMYTKYLSTNTINSIREKLVEMENEETDESKKINISKNIALLTSTIDEIISREKDESLIARYSSFQR